MRRGPQQPITKARYIQHTHLTVIPSDQCKILNTVHAIANSVALTSEPFSLIKLLIQREKRSFGQIVALTRSFCRGIPLIHKSP